ncbi:hypothetical protein BK799_31925 [Rhodococcus sp. D-1]|nr:hypothetical protein BK799_31925 [Rhodococcus sp. D-1]
MPSFKTCRRTDISERPNREVWASTNLSAADEDLTNLTTGVHRAAPPGAIDLNHDNRYRPLAWFNNERRNVLHEILLCRDADDCLSSQLLADEFPSVSFHDVEVKGFARFAGTERIGVDR